MAGDQFALGFGQVKRRAVRLGEGGDHKNREAGRAPRGEHVPMREDVELPAGLGGDDFGGGKRTSDEDDGHPGEEQREFVADELREGAHGREEGVFVAARPAGHKDREFGGGTGGEEVEDTGVEFDGDEVAAVGNDGEGENREREQHDRREEVQQVIGTARHDVFFGERLHTVGEGLRETEEAELGKRDRGAIGTGAILDTAKNLAFGEGDIGEEQAEDGQNDGDGKEAVDEPAPRLGEPRCHPVAGQEREAFQEGVGPLAHARGYGDHGEVHTAGGFGATGAANLAAAAAFAAAAAMALASAALRSAARRASTSAASVG